MKERLRDVLRATASKRWSVLTRTALHVVMLVITVGSLAIYAAAAFRPPRPQGACVYVVVAPASWLPGAVVVGIAALMSGRQSRRERNDSRLNAMRGARAEEKREALTARSNFGMLSGCIQPS